MTDQILLMNEHLKEEEKMIYLCFANSNCKVIILNIKKLLFHIWNLHKINV